MNLQQPSWGASLWEIEGKTKNKQVENLEVKSGQSVKNDIENESEPEDLEMSDDSNEEDNEYYMNAPEKSRK